MARIKFSPVVGEISGSIGGSTFQKNRFGFTVRKKPLPPSIISALQYNNRVNMARVISAWAGLTAAQRKAWDNFLSFSAAYARLNKNALLSGFNLFVRYNIIRLNAGLEIRTALSYVTPPFVPVGLTLELQSPSLPVIITEAIFPGLSSFFTLKMSAPVRPSASFSRVRLLNYVPYQVDDQIFNCADFFLNNFGFYPAVDQKINYELTIFSTLAPIISKPVTGQLIVQ